MNLVTLISVALKGVADDLIRAIEENRAGIEKQVADLYDKYLEPIDIPVVPDAIEKTIVDPLLKKLVVSAAMAVIDRAVEKLKILRDQPEPQPATV